MDFVRRGRVLEAIELLRGILLDEPGNIQARRVLAAIKGESRGRRSSAGRNLLRLARMTGLGPVVPEAVKRPIKRLISVIAGGAS
jgi:hypothetical protein